MEKMNLNLQEWQGLKFGNEELSEEEYDQKKVDEYNSTQGNLKGYDCSLCRNKGMIRFIDNGYIFTTTCTCMSKRKTLENTKKSGMGELLKNKVNNFIATEAFQKQMKEKAIEYVRNNHDEWFAMLGQSGCGKTMICSAITNNFLNQGKECIYVSWTSLMSELRNDIQNSGEIMSKYQSVEILYIDDFFKGQVDKGHVRETAYELINYRYNNNLTTIISSELSIDEIAKIDVAVAGRIKERSKKFMMFINKDEAKNYRMKTKESNND